jgi:hypothetical protein
MLMAAVGLCLVVGMPIPAHAQEAESRALIEKAIKAQGGEDVAVKLKAMIAKGKGTVHVMDMAVDFTVEAWSQDPGKHKAVIALSFNGMNIEIQQAFNGEKGWVSFAGMVKDMDADEIKEAKEQVHVEAVTSLYGIKGDKELKLSTLGESKVGDTVVLGVQVTKKGKRDVNLYFDKKTHLLAKAEYRAIDPISKMEVNQEKLFGAYKELVPGVKSASKITVNNDNKRWMDMELTEMRTVDRHDDSIFAKPQ